MTNGRPITILFGGPQRERVVLSLRDAGHDVSRVIAPAQQNQRLRVSVEALRLAGFVVIEMSRLEVSQLQPIRDDEILFSVGFPYLLSRELLDRFSVSLNLHPTMLPKYRGPTSGAYIIMNNEKQSGVTAHLIDEGMDTGAVVCQRTFDLTRFDTVRSLQRKAYSLEPEVAVEAVRLLQQPDFSPQPQDESRASVYQAKRTPADSEVDPTKSLAELYDFIRACDPDDYPAFFMLEGQKVCIRLWRPERPPGEPSDGL